MSFTIAKGLRNKKTLAGNLGTTSARILKNAVVSQGAKTDFAAEEQIALYKEGQSELRALKTAVAQKSVTLKLKMPDNLPNGYDEAGKEVPLFQAILIRDDLKGYRSILQKLIDIPTTTTEFDRKAGDYVNVERERKFDFEKTLKEIDEIQDLIDGVSKIIKVLI